MRAATATLASYRPLALLVFGALALSACPAAHPPSDACDHAVDTLRTCACPSSASACAPCTQVCGTDGVWSQCMPGLHACDAGAPDVPTCSGPLGAGACTECAWCRCYRSCVDGGSVCTPDTVPCAPDAGT